MLVLRAGQTQRPSLTAGPQPGAGCGPNTRSHSRVGTPALAARGFKCERECAVPLPVEVVAAESLTDRDGQQSAFARAEVEQPHISDPVDNASAVGGPVRDRVGID